MGEASPSRLKPPLSRIRKLLNLGAVLLACAGAIAGGFVSNAKVTLVVIVIAMPLLVIGCVASAVFVAQRERQRRDALGLPDKLTASTTIDVPLPVGDALEIAAQAMRACGANNIWSDAVSLRVEGVTRWTRRSWGQELTATVTKLEVNRSSLVCSSRPRLASTIYDWGAGRIALAQLVSQIESLAGHWHPAAVQPPSGEPGPGVPFASEASPGDLNSWVELEQQLEPPFGDMLDFRAELLRCIVSGRALCVRAQGGQVLGGVLYATEDATVRITWLGVRASARRLGVGRALVSAVIESCRPVCQMVVDVFAEDCVGAQPARQFFESLGFVPAEMLTQEPAGANYQRFRLPAAIRR